MHKIVAVKHLESDKHYIFNVPSHIELKKGDVVRVNTRYGDKIATCVTSSQEVNDDVLKMIMEDKRVLSSVTGIYKLTEFTEDEADRNPKPWESGDTLMFKDIERIIVETEKSEEVATIINDNKIIIVADGYTVRIKHKAIGEVGEQDDNRLHISKRVQK